MRHRARAAAFAFYSSDSPSRENFAGRFPELELDLCGVPPHVAISGAHLAEFQVLEFDARRHSSA